MRATMAGIDLENVPAVAEGLGGWSPARSLGSREEQPHAGLAAVGVQRFLQLFPFGLGLGLLLGSHRVTLLLPSAQQGDRWVFRRLARRCSAIDIARLRQGRAEDLERISRRLDSLLGGAR